MKLHSLNSLISIDKLKSPVSNKIAIKCRNLSIKKSKIIKILRSYSNVEVISINSLVSFKKKKAQVYKMGLKYSRTYAIQKGINSKKFILTFKHAADKVLFLSEISLE